MLKSCVKVPKLYEATKNTEDDYPGSLKPEEYKKAKDGYKHDSFKRGAMMFDDYNYE